MSKFKSIPALVIFCLSTTPVFAQELPASEGNTETQNLSAVSLEDLNSQTQYPVCNRMKNGVTRQKLQPATTE